MKGASHSNPNRHFLLPWILSALIWVVLSSIVLDEYKRTGNPLYIKEIFYLLSLLWVQFGFAAIFNTVRSRRYARLNAYIAVTVLPPLAVYFLMVL